MYSVLFDLDSHQLRILHSALSMDLLRDFLLPGIQSGSSSEFISNEFAKFLSSTFDLHLDHLDIDLYFVSPFLTYCSPFDIKNSMSDDYAISIHHFEFQNSLQLYLSSYAN